jgi:hypothetical protein
MPGSPRARYPSGPIIRGRPGATRCPVHSLLVREIQQPLASGTLSSEPLSLIGPRAARTLLKADFDPQFYGYQPLAEPRLNTVEPRRSNGMPGGLFQAWLANDGNPLNRRSPYVALWKKCVEPGRGVGKCKASLSSSYSNFCWPFTSFHPTAAIVQVRLIINCEAHSLAAFDIKYAMPGRFGVC